MAEQTAALLSAFTRLTSGEEMPAAEKVPAGSRQVLRQLRRARWRFSMRRALQRLESQPTLLLLWLLWLPITTALIAVALVLGAHDHSTTCIQEVGLVCASPGPGHSTDSSLHNATFGQAPQQGATGIPQAGP